MNPYRSAFWVALACAIVLAGALVWSWRRGPLARAGAGSAPAADPSLSEPGSPAAAPAAPDLVPLQLSPQRLQSIGVKTGVVRLMPVEDEIRNVGNVAVDERLQSYVQLRFSGWIQKVFADATYQYVRRGQPLFTIYSPELATTEREYLIARQNQRALAASTVPGVAAGAGSLLRASLERLEQWQVPAREIAHLEATGQASRTLEIDSPVSGFVTERNALPNLYAQPQTRLYTVANLSTVWVYAEFYQDQIEGIAPGDGAAVTVDTYPGRTFRGDVDFVYPEVDPQTRTVKVRLVFANPGLRLKPGMYVNVTVRKPLGRHLVIPASGAFQTGTRSIVFVDHGGGYLEPRTVELGRQVGGQYIVLSGLKRGEKIVTSANFLIDSESQLQAALGSFLPPPPGASQQALSRGPAAKVTFASQPSPPRQGDNVFVVTITGTNGTGIDGAKVTATFFMAAMPQMGMAAMRVPVTLAGEGGGVYRGTGKLPTPGTWQVTIMAQRNGQTIAAQQLTVSAGGGS